jgi:hypothetical protein
VPFLPLVLRTTTTLDYISEPRIILTIATVPNAPAARITPKTITTTLAIRIRASSRVRRRIISPRRTPFARPRRISIGHASLRTIRSLGTSTYS